MFGAERIDWFNGGLFDGDDVLPVERLDIKVIEAVGKLNWAQIEPAIFGTLFERSLTLASAPSYPGNAGIGLVWRNARAGLALY